MGRDLHDTPFTLQQMINSLGMSWWVQGQTALHETRHFLGIFRLVQDKKVLTLFFGCLSTEDISSFAKQDMSSVATEEMSSVATEDMSSVATEDEPSVAEDMSSVATQDMKPAATRDMSSVPTKEQRTIT